jgi:TonB family protein
LLSIRYTDVYKALKEAGDSAALLLLIDPPSEFSDALGVTMERLPLMQSKLNRSTIVRNSCVAALLLLVAASPISTLASVRESPMPVRTVSPAYPSELRVLKVSGLVVVECTVDANGNVTDARVRKSTNSQFDQFATDAVKQWKFKPAQLDGAPVSAAILIPVKFVADQS